MTVDGGANRDWSRGRVPARPEVAERVTYRPLADQEHFMVALLDEHIREALTDMHAPVGGRVLDVGCGEGPFATLLESLGYEYFGLDVAQNSRGIVDFVCSIEDELPAALSDREFDLVVCLEVLEHVSRWDAAFANLARLVAPGGSLLVTCPAFYPPHEEPYDFWRPTPHALARYGAAAGLTVRSADRVGDAWDVLGTVLAVIIPRPNGSSLRSLGGARALRFVRRLAFLSLRSGWPQRLVRLDSPLYLSNIAWFDRPARSAP